MKLPFNFIVICVFSFKAQVFKLKNNIILQIIKRNIKSFIITYCSLFFFEFHIIFSGNKKIGFYFYFIILLTLLNGIRSKRRIFASRVGIRSRSLLMIINAASTFISVSLVQAD